MNEPERKQEQTIKSGGAYVGKNVNTGGGTFVGRDQVAKRGDVVTTIMGNNARNVAAGKNVTQINQQLNPSAAAEAQAIAKKFTQIQQLFQMGKSELPDTLHPILEDQLHLLQTEIAKIATDEHPSIAAITMASKLLAEMAPALKLSLQELLTLPMIQRLISKVP